MPQELNTVDPEFVRALQANISGIYYPQVAGLKPEKIEAEFRRAVREPKLLADEEFLQNLLFLVRKKEVRALREDVARLVSGGQLKPGPDTSALKTLYALGAGPDRALVDERLARLLENKLRTSELSEPLPYLEAADRIGGPKTLPVLTQGLTDATARQQQAEREQPDNHNRIAQLDIRRAALADKQFVLSNRLAILSREDTERGSELAKVYLRRSPPLNSWGFKELVDHPAPEAVTGVRRLIARELESLLPTGGVKPEDRAKMLLDLRLRGVCLLQLMNAALTAEETQLLNDHKAGLLARKEFFFPKYDWEDVLDRQ